MSGAPGSCPRCGEALEPAEERCPSCGLAFEAPTMTGGVELQDGGVAAPPTTLIAPGQVLASRYEIQRRLGKGGMSTVYLAYDRVLNEQVAVKLLRPDLLADATMRERFKSEIRLARKVRHPNVCSIYEFGEAPEGPFISMELIEGSNLKQVLRKGGRPVPEAFDLAIQVAEGLQAVHEAGIVHRDLKSANLMIDAAGRVRLMDFGIAKREGERTLTTGQMIVGTPAYMSPEQAQGMKVGPRSDVYALGVVVFELFTGRLPFTAPSALGVALKQVHDEPPLEEALLPHSVRPILANALAKEPSARYATARAVARALRAAWTEAAAPPSPAPAAAAGRTPVRARWGFGLGAALLIAAAVAARIGVGRHDGGVPAHRPGDLPATVSPPEARPEASLLVVVRPWGELAIDGRPAGTTPLDWLSVAPGTHSVRVRHPTHGTWEGSLTLAPGERRRLVVDLRSSPAGRR